jgi:hypothetical protein
LLGAVTLARFPITWNQLIEKEALKFKDLMSESKKSSNVCGTHVAALNRTKRRDLRDIGILSFDSDRTFYTSTAKTVSEFIF